MGRVDENLEEKNGKESGWRDFHFEDNKLRIKTRNLIYKLFVIDNEKI